MNLSIKDIAKARAILNGVVDKTALVNNTMLSKMSGNDIYLKMENLQRTGSFKIRGAYNKIANLSEEQRNHGVIASSAGNHAQGVALAANIFGIKSMIIMPKHAPLSKMMSTRQYGAEVVLHGEVYDEAYEEAKCIQGKNQMVFIHPFNDPLVIAGQGTIALEIIEQLPEVDAVVIPIGGGGLISGIALGIKALNPKVKIIGVQTKAMPSMALSVRKKHLTTVAACSTIADGIAVKTPGELTFEIVNNYVDDIVTVDEDEIASTILLYLEKAKVVAEGAGAASGAAILHHLSSYKNQKIVVLVSGGNIDVNILARTIDKGLLKSGRKCFQTTIVHDRPGTLWKLLKLISEMGANVIAVNHQRETLDIPLGYAKVELELETIDEDQAQKIKHLLRKNFHVLDIKEK